MRLLDLFCGRFGWSRAFAERGWGCVGVDLVEPPEIPAGCTFSQIDILKLTPEMILEIAPDFICASSPCEQFSCFSMKMFQPNPPYPSKGIELFDHTRMLCELSKVPYVMENVRGAEQFVGKSVSHCGSFHLWGNAVPPLLPQGITKSKWKANAGTKRDGKPGNFAPELLWSRKERAAKFATIPPELSACVADYAERILEQRATA